MSVADTGRPCVVAGLRPRGYETGPVATTFTVSVATNEAGKAIGKASAGADDGTAARVALDTRAFMRRIAGRWPVDQLGAEISGDASLAAQVLEAIVVTP